MSPPRAELREYCERLRVRAEALRVKMTCGDALTSVTAAREAYRLERELQILARQGASPATMLGANILASVKLGRPTWGLLDAVMAYLFDLHHEAWPENMCAELRAELGLEGTS